MREIKFRAWDKTYNKMVNLFVAGFWKLFITFDGEIGGYEDDDKYEDCAIYGDRFIPMQFTGLLDTNGIEIYESDILKDEYGRILLVEWFKCGFSLRALTDTNFIRANNIMQWFDYDISQPEIIGNKFQNPDLLKEATT